MADDGDADKAERPPTAGGRARTEQNEWTASDKRGPLDAAEAEQAAAERAASANDGAAAAAPGASSQASSSPAQASSPPPASAQAAASDASAAAPDHTGPAASAAPASTEPRRHVPVLPIIAALVVGAVIGAGSAAVVYKASDQGASQAEVNGLASRLDTVEKRPDPQPEIDQLKAALARPSTPAAPAFDPAPLQQKIAGLQADLDALKQQSADHSLGDKVTALGTSVAALQAQGAEVKSLGDKVSGLTGSLDGLEKELGGLKQEDADAKAGIASLQSGQKSLEGKTGAPALAVAADSLVTAIAQGRPYAGQVAALAGLGADPTRIAVLRENADKGVPSAQVLATKFAPLADPITATASQAPPNASLGDQLKSGLFGMVSVRRSDATAGDDVASRVSRIEADLAHDNVAGAYETWNGLPAAAKAKSEAWGALAKTQVEAMAAARALQAQAIAALGGKKS